MEKRPTIIKDIADALNVSNATVSRVLSESDYPVSEDMKNAIISKAKELNYYSFILERNIKRDPHDTIGVIIPTFANPFFSQLVNGVESESLSRKYLSVVSSSNRSLEIEEKSLKMLLQKGVDGIILHSVGGDLSIVSDLLEIETELVILNQDVESLNISSVQFDFYEAGYMATEYFLLRGHEKIAFLSPPIDRQSRKSALSGYFSALSAFGAPIKDEFIISAETEFEKEDKIYEYENGRILVNKFLAIPDRPTAIFTINDLTAYGIISELNNYGVSVPEDISVIGLDDLYFSTISTPALTTINQPAYETGRLAARVLLDQIKNKSAPKKILLRPSIVERNSVKSLF